MANPEVVAPHIDVEVSSEIISELRAEIAELREQVSALTRQVARLAANSSIMVSEETDLFADNDEPNEKRVVENNANKQKHSTTAQKAVSAGQSMESDKTAEQPKNNRIRNIVALAGAAVVSAAVIFGLSKTDSDDNGREELQEQLTSTSMEETSPTPSSSDNSESNGSSSGGTETTQTHLSESKMQSAIESIGLSGRASVFESWDENIADDSPIEAFSGSMNTGKTLEAAADGEMTINDTIEISQNTLQGAYGADRAEDARIAMRNAGFTDADIDEFMQTGSMSNFQTFAVQMNENGTFTNTPYVDANGNVVEGTRHFAAGDIFLVHVASDGSTIVTRIDCGAFIQDGKFTFKTPPKPPTREVPPTTSTTTPETTTTTVPDTTTTTTPETTTTTVPDTTTTTVPSTTTTTPPTTSTTLPIHPPADGPPPEATIPPIHQPGTPGYEPGNAEDVADQQDSETPGGVDPTEYGTPAPDGSPSGEDQIVDQPGDDAPDNPDYEPGTESPGTNEGVNDRDNEDSETDFDDETSEPGNLDLDPLAGVVIGGLGLGAEQIRRRYISAPKGMTPMHIDLEEEK